MKNERLRVAIIVGSTREGRFGPVVARWIERVVRARGDMDVDYLDLVETDLPPVMSARSHEGKERFAARIDAADAFVVVTPEYNHSYPAPLKHAIDAAFREWNAKPVALVSYGGASGGLRASEHLRAVFAELGAPTIRDTVSFPFAWKAFDEAGEPRDRARPLRAAHRMLDSLAWWAHTLRDGRQVRPLAA